MSATRARAARSSPLTRSNTGALLRNRIFSTVAYKRSSGMGRPSRRASERAAWRATVGSGSASSGRIRAAAPAGSAAATACSAPSRTSGSACARPRGPSSRADGVGATGQGVEGEQRHVGIGVAAVRAAGTPPAAAWAVHERAGLPQPLAGGQVVEERHHQRPQRGVEQRVQHLERVGAPAGVEHALAHQRERLAGRSAAPGCAGCAGSARSRRNSNTSSSSGVAYIGRASFPASDVAVGLGALSR